MHKTIGSIQTRRQMLKQATSLAGLAASATVLPGLSPRLHADQHNTLPIGMNLTGIADWEPGYPFLNLMWGARPWSTRTFSSRGSSATQATRHLELDENGYPLEVPFKSPNIPGRQFVYTIVPNVLDRGRYILLYDGEGTITTAGATRILNKRPGRIELSMHHGRSDDHLEIIQIRASKRGNHIRNMRLVPLSQEQTNLSKNPFRPEFLEYCKPWHCLRYMDWLGTNNSINTTWNKRKKPHFYTQIGHNGDTRGLFGDPMPAWKFNWPSGVAIELCIQLANTVKRDAWLCVPHEADDQYIEQMATLVRDTLDPSLKVYIEFSNELWNWGFIQAQWMIRSTLAGHLLTEAGHPPPWKDGAEPQPTQDGIARNTPGIKFPQRMGALFVRCFKIWERVFEGRHRHRLMRVCTVQNDWHATAQDTLDWVMAHGGCDAYAPAGYFAPDEKIYRDWELLGANLTPAKVLQDMRRSIAMNATQLSAHAKTARNAGVELIIYEGGQHIQPKGHKETPYNPALAAAQKHPEMYSLYEEHLKHFIDSNCSLFCAYNSISKQGTRWGSWGHLESYDQPATDMPKQSALLDANTKHIK